MSFLKNQDTEQLVSRWNSLIPGYLNSIKQLKDLGLEIIRKETELNLIRDELLSRGIEPDDVQTNDGGSAKST